MTIFVLRKRVPWYVHQASNRSYLVLSTCCTYASRGASVHLPIKLGARQQVHCIPQIQDPETENTSMIGKESAHLPVRGHLGPKSKCWEQLVPVEGQ